MATLSDARDTYYALSGKASDGSRQLAFAGLAMVWIFKTAAADDFALPRVLLWPAGCFALGLFLDLLHYAVGSALWSAFARTKERQHVPLDAECEPPHWINWPALAMFWLKQLAVGIGYVLLLIYMARRIALV